MGYRSRREVNPVALVFSDDINIRPDFLPTLRTFKGHCENVGMMAKAGLMCLASSLTTLTIGVGHIDDPMGAINRMFDAIQTSRLPSGRLGSLKELDFDFFKWDPELEREAIPAFVRRWGEICGPSLEVWKGLIPFVWSWTPAEFADFFSAFPKLRVLWIANDSTVFGVFPREDEEEDGDENDPEDAPTFEFEEYCRMLAQTCGSLEEVWVTWGPTNACWRIERGPGTRLVVRCID
ncbi:hypothetical protein C8R43DRAFT_1053714 [Mycena crocata]|nr:hypothetical protein C8R43DRAFT_1053714 [Mycena crocata]